jgi:hypothetical protein
LGRHALVSAAQADLSIEARVEHEGDRARWYAVIALRDAKGTVLGTRELASESVDCGPLRDSVALAMALMIDPDATLHPLPPPPVVAPPVAAERDKQAPAVIAPPAAWRWNIAAQAAIGFGTLPKASGGVEVDLRATPPRFWQIDLYGGLWAPQTEPVQSHAQTRFTMAYGGLDVCPVRVGDPRQLAFRLCAGGEFGVVQSTSEGFDTMRSQELATLDAVVRGSLDVPLGSALALVFGGRLGLALLNGHFVYEDASSVQHDIFDRPLVTATASAGLAVTLP